MLKAGVLAEPVLVGRERELADIMRNLELAFEGKGTTVFVSGEAGSGKTRLINEFLGIIKEKEIAILYGWCLADIATPYFPFMEAFSTYYSPRNPEEREAEQVKSESSDIKAWLLGPKPAKRGAKLQDLSPQAWQDLTFAAVTNTLLSISSRKPAILFLDDVHWADTASLSLLHYISRSIRSSRVFVLATFRSEELNPDEEGRPHPLVDTLRLMRREDLLSEIKLPRLNQADIAVLAEKMVGGSLHSELVCRLSGDSQGNPLFIVESLRMLAEHGSLVQDRGRWQVSIDAVGIPGKIKDIILRRVDMLKPSQKRVLGLASAIGNKFDVELLGAVLNQDSLEVLETLNSVAQSSSLVSCKGSIFEFDHTKSREAIYEEISPPLRRGYHARIAEKMEEKSKDPKDLPVSDLAYHYARAGIKEKAVEYALAAGEDALARFSNAEATRHYAYVLDAAAGASECAVERTRALEGLGDALIARGLFLEAMKSFEQLSSVSESGVVKLRALRKTMVCSFWVGNPAHSLELGCEANGYAQFDRLEYARLRLFRGFVADRFGKTDEAFEDMEGALRVFEEEYSLSDVASALDRLVFFYMAEGRFEDQFAAALRSVTLYEELKDLRGQLDARSKLDWILRESGFYQEALCNIEESVKISEKVGNYNVTALLLWGAGLVHDLRGDHRGAIAESLKAAEYAEKTDSYYTQSVVYGYLVMEYAKLGETERAENFDKKRDLVLEEAAKIKDHAAEPESDFSLGKALLFTAKGQWKEANEILDKYWEKREKWSSRWGSGKEVTVRINSAWALAKQGRTEEANKLLQEAEKIRGENAARLKRFEHANVHAFLVARREIGTGEALTVRLDLVNVAKNPALLVRMEGLIPPGFEASALPLYCSVQNDVIVLNGKELSSFTVEPLKINLRAAKAGIFTLSPLLVYVDDMGETKTCKPEPITITVKPAQPKYEVLPGRVSTGLEELDALIFGGIPQNFAVALTAPSTDEREKLVRHFLEAGATAGETTFFITAEAGSAKILAEKYPSNFYLFLCNPQADTMIQNAPNVFKLKGVENLTDIDIALTKAFRVLDTSAKGPKRICIDIVSDVLLQHHAVITRHWLSALLPTLKSKGFTLLAVIDPQMHPAEELQSVLGVFDGEIRVTEKETSEGTRQMLKVRKLRSQKYLENELTLSKETSLP